MGSGPRARKASRGSGSMLLAAPLKFPRPPFSADKNMKCEMYLSEASRRSGGRRAVAPTPPSPCGANSTPTNTESTG